MQEPINSNYLLTCSQCNTQFEPSEELAEFLSYTQYEGSVLLVGDNLISSKEFALYCKNCTQEQIDSNRTNNIRGHSIATVTVHYHQETS
jgi:hypothetical protein